MPLTYEIEAARQLIHTTGAGTLTDADVMAHRASLAADPAFVAGMPARMRRTGTSMRLPLIVYGIAGTW